MVGRLPRRRTRRSWRWTGRIAETHAPDDVYEEARQHLTEEELVKLTLAIG
jgi:alkylhydroperoxidase family enzyme